VSGRILRYIAPLLGSQAVQLGAGSAATAVLGRSGGALGLAAAVAPIALSGLCGALFSGFTAGAMVLLARAKRSGDKYAEKRVIAEGLGIAVILGVLFAAAILALDARIMHAMNVDPALMPLATAYTRVVAMALPVSFVYAMYGALLEGDGDSKTPFLMLVVSAAIFLVLLAAFVPRYGAIGVPVASLCASLTVALAVVSLGRVRPRLAVPARETMQAMLRIDLPIAVQYTGVMLADMALISIVNGYGAQAAAAYGVVNQIVLFVMAPISLFATAVSVFAGQALSAGRTSRALRALRSSLAMNLALTIAITVLGYVFVAPVTRAFTADPQTLALAREAIFAMLWSVPVLGIGGVVCGLMDAMGDGFWPMVTSLAGVWFVLVPCAHAFSSHDGAIGVWQAYPVAYAAIAFVQVCAALILQKKRRLTFEAPSSVA
jgi:putative MATE family efflux protein